MPTIPSAKLLANSFEIISRLRSAERNFSPADINSTILQKVLELTQLAPSSFNMQPYKGIVIQSEKSKELLASCMLGGNCNVVMSAPVSVIFLGDKGKKLLLTSSLYPSYSLTMQIRTDPSRNIGKLMQLELKNGSNPEYVNTIPSRINFLYGNGLLSTAFRKVVTHLTSPLSAAPKIARDNESFAYKNAALAGMQFMLAATSLGLSTCPMEGFDERRICYGFNIPTNYGIPFVISLGYAQNGINFSQDDSLDESKDELQYDLTAIPLPKKVRFNLEDVFCSNTFGEPFRLK